MNEALPSRDHAARLTAAQGITGALFAFGLLLLFNVGVMVFAVVVSELRGPGGSFDVAGAMSRMKEQGLLTSFPVLAAGQLANLAAFVGVAAVLPALAKVPHRDALGLRAAPAAAYPLAMLGIVALNPLADLIVRGVKGDSTDEGTLELIANVAGGQPLPVLLVVLALVPALGEELLCRGVLLRSIRRPALAIPASAIVFSLLHLDPVHIAGVIPLGFFLAWVGYRTDSLFPPVAAHFANNAVASVGMWFAARHPELSDPSETLPLWAAPLGVAISAGTLYGIARSTAPRLPPPSSTSP